MAIEGAVDRDQSNGLKERYFALGKTNLEQASQWFIKAISFETTETSKTNSTQATKNEAPRGTEYTDAA